VREGYSPSFHSGPRLIRLERQEMSCDKIVIESIISGNIRMKTYYVYILANLTGTIYTGFTNDLQRRVYEHKNKMVEGFTKKYNVSRLVYFEESSDVNITIAREKEIKGWGRSKKIALIRTMNPTFKDLSEEWYM
jgi:putative endonuclease